MTTSLLKLELDRARQSLVERAVVMGRVFDSHEAERRMLANELHEESAQAMAAILLGLRSLERDPTPEGVAVLRGHAEQALGRLRKLAVSLRPPVLDHMGLVPALARLAPLEVDGDRERLPEQVETVAYRVAEQAVGWLEEPVVIRLSEVADLIELTVVGSGSRAGVDPLWAIRARVELIGGTLTVDPAAATVVCRIPARSRPRA
jgi:signal transduction histidine kinase